jgi:hypothetical protein
LYSRCTLARTSQTVALNLMQERIPWSMAKLIGIV